MLKGKTGCICIFALIVVFGIPDDSVRADPGWSPVIVATGSYRSQIRSMPIEQRPYRPLHFYGNTIRRRHYRGTSSSQLSTLQRSEALTSPWVVPFSSSGRAGPR